MLLTKALSPDGKPRTRDSGKQHIAFLRTNLSQLAREGRRISAGKLKAADVDGAKEAQKGSRFAQTAGQLQASNALPNVRCLAGLNGAVLSMLARVAQRRHFPQDVPVGGDKLLAENAFDTEFLWVLEHGSVQVEERGEVLGTLEAGMPLGLPVVLGFAERQLVTVRKTEDAPLTAWCIPHAAISSAVRQSPDARQALEEVMDKQTRKLFVSRVAKTVFFAHCCKHFFQPLQGQMKAEYFKRNSVLFRDGEYADSMMVLVRGTCHMMPAALQKRRLAKVITAKSGSRMVGSLHRMRMLVEVAKLRQESATIDNVEGPPPMGGGGLAGDEAESESGDDSSDTSSSRTSEDSDEGVTFTLPESKVCVDPAARPVTATAGPSAVVLGDSSLLGFQEIRPCTAVAACDCVVFVVSRHLFSASLKLHPQETRHFDQMARAKYQEWHHCGLRRLPEVDIFSQGSPAFLSALAAVAQPRLYFPGHALITKGSSPEGLVLLMAGTAEQQLDDGSSKRLSAPHSFGPLQFLGAKLPCEPLEAVEFCQVLYLSRKDILECLQHHPEESTPMVLQVLRHNGRRLSLVRRSVGDERGDSPEPVLQLNLWHLPLCRGLDPHFIEAFTARLELVKVVPGQLLFRSGDDAEVLAVLLKGRVSVRSELASERELRVPLLLCGRNRKMPVEATAVELCDLHRLSLDACDALAEAFPQDMRSFLDRATVFQSRVHTKLGYPWWSPYAALRAQDVFAGSQEEFLVRVAEKLSLEIYLPGDKLVVEGQRVDSTMIIESGEAVVQKIDHRVPMMTSSNIVATAGDGFWIGGVASICGFAGELKRSATIRATKVCKVHRLMNAVFVDVLTGFPEERQRFRQLAEHQLQTRGEAESLEDHNFFKGLSRDLLNLLRPKCRPLVFFADEAIMHQGEPADSLYILGAHSNVTIEVDGERVREHNGRACLGIVALLSKWPVKRASTVVTRIACSVRSLSRHDWLESLKHHPEHRRWIDSFTAEQMEKVGEARGQFNRRRAWDKIQSRESGASQQHRERMTTCGYYRGGGSRASSSPRPFLAGSMTPRAAKALAKDEFEGPAPPPETPRRPTRKAEQTTLPLENWDCFNGKQATVPHTRLPRLGGTSTPGPGAEAAGGDLAADFPTLSDASELDGGRRQTLDVRRRATLDIWQACEQAIGMDE